MSNFFETIIQDIEGLFSSTVGLEITEFGATAAGVASSLAIVEKANPSNKTGTANDIFALASAAYTLLHGSTVPTQDQINSIFASFKSESSTSEFEALAQSFATQLSGFFATNAGANWSKIASSYVYGWQLGAQILGGSATSPAAN